ncbi:MAG: M20/M25/M40 family metallo-hydrolase [Acidobacteriota bacterium]
MKIILASVLACMASWRPVSAAPADPLARDIYKELVEIDTSHATGDTHKAAEAMAARLRAAGFGSDDVHVYDPAPKKGDLVARLRGTGRKKPMILMAHIDVVDARREDWTTDPFKLVEKDGYFYGRGTGDDKYMAAAWVANMIRWKKERYRPDRDLILILECDEETGDDDGDGIQWLIKNHKDLIAAEFALNEGGAVGGKGPRPQWNSIQTTEKLYVTFTLDVRNRGGHSSQPRKDNAIYELSEALVRLSGYEFPIELNDTTRAYFAKSATLETGQTAADMKSLVSPRPDPAALARLATVPAYNAELRTTCVATRLEAGHADNALPQLAHATVNCRILPGHTIGETERTLESVLADPAIAIAPKEKDTSSPPSPLRKDLLAAADKLTAKYWPGIPVIPTMSTGATDGRYLRKIGIQTYGHSGLAVDILDNRAHGKDERVSVKAFDDGVAYLYELVKLLAGGR